MQHQYNPNKPFATLMRGRADEPDTHQHVAVYSQEEYEKYRLAGWMSCKDFMARVERAMRRDN